MVDKSAIIMFWEVVFLGMVGERELSGLLEWRREERTKACEFVGCVEMFKKNKTQVPLKTEGVKITWLVLLLLLKSP